MTNKGFLYGYVTVDVNVINTDYKSLHLIATNSNMAEVIAVFGFCSGTNDIIWFEPASNNNLNDDLITTITVGTNASAVGRGYNKRGKVITVTAWAAALNIATADTEYVVASGFPAALGAGVMCAYVGVSATSIIKEAHIKGDGKLYIRTNGAIPSGTYIYVSGSYVSA